MKYNKHEDGLTDWAFVKPRFADAVKKKSLQMNFPLNGGISPKYYAWSQIQRTDKPQVEYS